MTQRPLAAALWMSGSIASFISMAIAGRAVAGVHDTFEIMTWRSLVGFILVLIAAAATGQMRLISARRWPEHLLRNVFHFTGQNLWFWALTMIPLAQVFALEFTAPVWVILLSPLVLGEKITRARAAAAGLGFLGVLIVAHPSPTHLSPGILAAAACAIGFAVSALLTRDMVRKGEAVISILFWLTLMQFCMGLGMAMSDGRMALPTADTAPWLLLIGFAGVFAHFCLTRALSFAPASFVMPIDFIRLPLIALVGMALYDEPLDLLVLIGAAVIFAGNWINIRAETRTNSPQRSVAKS
ncbi:MAG: DMT family transporter [Paracoccaceae bacterium]